jgi:hypothetical protein
MRWLLAEETWNMLLDCCSRDDLNNKLGINGVQGMDR